jgi:hypothetical protein
MKNFNTVQKLQIRNRVQQIILQEMLPQSPPAPSPSISYAFTDSSDTCGHFNQSTEYTLSYEDYNHPQNY